MNDLSIWHWMIIIVVIGSVWLPLPFAIYGTKRKLDRQIELLEQLLRVLDQSGSKADTL